MDPREEIKFVDFSIDRYNSNNEKVVDLINSINYSKSLENYIPLSKYLIKNAYYSKDWYIADTYQGLIGKCLDNDYRAKEEFDSYMNMLNKEKEEQPKVLKRKL